MAEQDNKHIKSYEIAQKVKNWSFAGIPQHIQAQLAGISVGTLAKYYKYELLTGEAEIVADVSECATMKALEGDDNMQRFLLKTKGAKYGFVEKQVIEQQDSAEVEELRKQVAELDKKHEADY